MSLTDFEDKRAAKLMSRVGDDLAALRHDVKKLVKHAARHTLPDGARELAATGREGLLHGRDYTADQVRRLGHGAREHPAGVSVAGLLLLAAVGVGLYLWTNEGSRQHEQDEFDED